MENSKAEISGKSIEVGRVRLDLGTEGELDGVVVHPTGRPYETLLTLDPVDSASLFRVLEHIFGYWDERPAYPPPPQLWRGSKFHYLAPLLDRPNIFWVSVGPLNSYLNLSDMKAVHLDFKAALDQASLTII